MFSVNTSGPAPSLALHLSQLASGPLKVDYYNMVRGQQHPMVLYNNSVQMKLQILSTISFNFTKSFLLFI